MKYMLIKFTNNQLHIINKDQQIMSTESKTSVVAISLKTVH